MAGMTSFTKSTVESAALARLKGSAGVSPKGRTGNQVGLWRLNLASKGGQSFLRMAMGGGGTHRRSVRLKGYDYSQAGTYFVTICTQERQCLFGERANGAVPFTEYGATANQFWLDIPRHWPHLALDALVVMPNHVHGIVVIMPTNVGAPPVR